MCPRVVLDSFELNMNDRLYYKVVDPQGKVISGFDDLPAMPPATSRTQLYPALAWFLSYRIPRPGHPRGAPAAAGQRRRHRRNGGDLYC